MTVGDLRFSSDDVLRLYAIVAREMVENALNVTMNWVTTTQSIRSGSAIEQSASRFTAYCPNAFEWPYLRPNGVQRFRMTSAWRRLEEVRSRYLSKGFARTAIGYAQNAREPMTAFLNHADPTIDNNPMENASPSGHVRASQLTGRGQSARGEREQSLVESAKRRGLESKAYLQVLAERYPLARTTEERRDLHPMFIDMPRCRG